MELPSLGQTRFDSLTDSIHIESQCPEGDSQSCCSLILQLDDSALFRQQAYVNGQWIDAKDGKTFDVTGIPRKSAPLTRRPSQRQEDRNTSRVHSHRDRRSNFPCPHRLPNLPQHNTPRTGPYPTKMVRALSTALQRYCQNSYLGERKTFGGGQGRSHL